MNLRGKGWGKSGWGYKSASKESCGDSTVKYLDWGGGDVIKLYRATHTQMSAYTTSKILKSSVDCTHVDFLLFILYYT